MTVVMYSPSPSNPLMTERVRSRGELAGALEHALNVAVSRGARIHPDCRLKFYVKCLQERLGGVSVEHLSEVRMEVDEIVSSLEDLRAQPEVPNWHLLVERVSKGPRFVSSSTPEKADDARAGQVELMIAAAGRSAGAVISFREPYDAVAVVDGNVLHLEAKRPTSRRTVSKNVREACKQVSRENGYGAVFIDLNQAMPLTKIIQVTDYVEAHQELQPQLWHRLKQVSGDVLNALDPPESGAGRRNAPCPTTVLGALTVLRGRFVIPRPDGALHHGFIHAIRIERRTRDLEDVPQWFREFAESLVRLSQPPSS